MQRIILDTNFLLIPAQFNVDIFSDIERIADFRYELCVLDKTMEELDKIIREQKGKHKANAKLAKSILKAKKVNVIVTKEDKYVDDILKGMKDSIIATQDKELAKELKNKGIKTIRLRGKKHLILS